MAEPLHPARREGDGTIALRPRADGPAALSARFIEPLRVVSLRGVADSSGPHPIAGALSAHALALPEPGYFAGVDPAVLWRSPTEWLLVASSDPVPDAVLRALMPGRHALACALDQSAGVIGIALDGEPVDALLSRLVDASAIPREPGHGTRARLGDIAVTILRPAADRAWLIAERGVEDYLVEWIAYAAANTTVS